MNFKSTIAGCLASDLSSPELRGVESSLSPSSEQNRELPDGLVQMNGVQVKYGKDTVIGDWNQMIDGAKKVGLWWSIKPGDRWGLFGPNGALIQLAFPAKL